MKNRMKCLACLALAAVPAAAWPAPASAAEKDEKLTVEAAVRKLGSPDWQRRLAARRALVAAGREGAEALLGVLKPGADEVKRPEVRKQVRGLIGRLGSGKYAERRDAERRLEAIGWPAVPQLREAAASDDLEVALRANALLEKLDVGGVAPPARRRIEAVKLLGRAREPRAAAALVECIAGGDDVEGYYANYALARIAGRSCGPFVWEDRKAAAALAGRWRKALAEMKGGPPLRPPEVAGYVYLAYAPKVEMVAVDLAGKDLWRYEPPNNSWPRSFAVKPGGTLLVTTTRGKAFEYDPARKKTVWRHEPVTRWTSVLPLADGRLLVAANYGRQVVLVSQAEPGKTLWTMPGDRGSYYALCLDPLGGCTAIDRRTGEVTEYAPGIEEAVRKWSLDTRHYALARLACGDTAAVDAEANEVVVLGPAAEVVWKADLPLPSGGALRPQALHALPDGGFLVAGDKLLGLVRIGPDGKVVFKTAADTGCRGVDWLRKEPTEKP